LNAALKLGETHASALGWGQQTALSVEAVSAGPSANGPFEDLEQRFIAAMDDDLNSSGALAVLFELARPLRGLANRLDRGDQPEQPADELNQLQSRWMLLRELAAVLGLRSETDEPQPLKTAASMPKRLNRRLPIAKQRKKRRTIKKPIAFASPSATKALNSSTSQVDSPIGDWFNAPFQPSSLRSCECVPWL